MAVQCYSIARQTIRNPDPAINAVKMRVSMPESLPELLWRRRFLGPETRYVLKHEPDNVVAACRLTSTSTIDGDSPGNYSPDGCTIAHAPR